MCVFLFQVQFGNDCEDLKECSKDLYCYILWCTDGLLYCQGPLLKPHVASLVTAILEMLSSVEPQVAVWWWCAPYLV